MGDPAKKHGPGQADEIEELPDEDLEEDLESSAVSESQPQLKAVPKAPETYTEEWERKYAELGIEKFDFGKPEEGTVFLGDRPPRPKTKEEIAEEKRYFESGKDWSTDLDTEHLIRTKIRESVQTALEKPLSISPQDALSKTGAQILREKYGAHSNDRKSMVVETLSGPMAVAGGLQEPHALLIPYGKTKIMGITSPGPKQGNEYLKNQAGFVIKPSLRKKSIHIFMAKGNGEGPYLADQAAGLANAALAEAGALLHTEEDFHPATVLDYMNVCVNDLKKKMKIERQVAPMIAAELDMSEERAILRVASAGNIHCLIVNPHSGAVISAPRQVVEERLKSKGFNEEDREAIYKKVGEKFDLSPENAAKAVTVAGGRPEDEFMPDIVDYHAPAGSVVVLVTDELVQSLAPDFKNKELVIGKFIHDALEEGLTVEEACAKIAQGYLSHQKKTGQATSFSLVGFKVPSEVKKTLIVPKQEPKTKKNLPPLDLDFSDL